MQAHPGGSLLTIRSAWCWPFLLGARVLATDYIQGAAKATEFSSYGFGVGTFVTGFMGWLDMHYLAVGAICAVISAAANIFFKWLERRDRLKRWRQQDAAKDKS